MLVKYLTETNRQLWLAYAIIQPRRIGPQHSHEWYPTLNCREIHPCTGILMLLMQSAEVTAHESCTMRSTNYEHLTSLTQYSRCLSYELPLGHCSIQSYRPNFSTMLTARLLQLPLLEKHTLSRKALV